MKIKKDMAKIEVIIEVTNTGYSAYAEKYPAFTTGGNFEELKHNILESLNLYFDEANAKPITAENLKLTMDLPQFFEFYNVINASALAERIGINRSLLSQYVKGIKKPSSIQVNKIMKGVQDLGRELAAIQLT